VEEVLAFDDRMWVVGSGRHKRVVAYFRAKKEKEGGSARQSSQLEPKSTLSFFAVEVDVRSDYFVLLPICLPSP
jgi:hypothetical protein